MTQLQILKYAYGFALEVWSREYDRSKEEPDNEIRKARLADASKNFEEIRELLWKEEQKEARA